MPNRRTRVWDLPTRAFHWTFATLIVASWLSGQFGGRDWLEWHFVSGYALLALLAFRILWGFAGARYARFAVFPLRLTALTRAGRTSENVGHTPRGAWSIYAMLIAAVVQVLTGLMSTDGDFTEGPWAKLVSDRTMSLMTSIHEVNRWVLLALVVLHVAAIAWYSLVQKREIVRPMLTGDITDDNALPARDDAVIRLRGAILLLLAAALTAYLVQL